FSRRYCTRRVRGSTSPVTALPFTVSATADMALLLEIRPKDLVFRTDRRDRRRIGAKSGRVCPGTWVGTNRLCTCGARAGKSIGGMQTGRAPASSSPLRHRRGEFHEVIIGRPLHPACAH